MTALTGIGNGGQPGQNRQILTPGLTQITGFGSIYYAFGMLAAPMGDTLGLSQPQAYAALSASGPYASEALFYHDIAAWNAGMGIAAAAPITTTAKKRLQVQGG